MDATTLAYAASVIDLHARLSIRTLPTESEQPVVQINWNHYPVLEHLANLTGVKVVETHRGYYRAGCAEHCAEKHQHVDSRSGRWVVTGARATVLLWNVRPYLIFQADRARELIVAGTQTNIKPATVQKMVDLGWEIPDFAILSG